MVKKSEFRFPAQRNDVGVPAIRPVQRVLVRSRLQFHAGGFGEFGGVVDIEHLLPPTIQPLELAFVVEHREGDGDGASEAVFAASA